MATEYTYSPDGLYRTDALGNREKNIGGVWAGLAFGGKDPGLYPRTPVAIPGGPQEATVSTQPVESPQAEWTPNPERAARIGFFDQLAAGNPDAWRAAQAKNEREQAAIREQNSLKRATIGAINQNPDLIWEDPRWVLGMTPEQQWEAWQIHNRNFQEGTGNLDQQGRVLSQPEVVQSMTDYIIANHDDPTRSNTDLLGDDWISNWVWAVHGLFARDPQAFLEWERNNPEMAIRWHAQMGERFSGQSNTQNWAALDPSFEEFPHNARAREIAYNISQDLGYGEDGKNDGKIVLPGYKYTDAETNKSGSSDFWKVGTPQSLTDGFGNMVEDNAWEIAALAALAAVAPYAANAVGWGTGSAAAGAATYGGVTAAGSSAILGGSLEDVLKAGAIGAFGGWGASEFASALGVSQQTGEAIKTGVTGLAKGKSPEQILMDIGLDIGADALDDLMDNPAFHDFMESIGLSGGSASRDAIVAGVEEAVKGGDPQDILQEVVGEYIDEDGKFTLGSDIDIPFENPFGDLDLENPFGDWDPLGDLGDIDLPSWQLGESIPTPDWNWEGSESIDINAPDFEFPDVDIEVPDMPEMPDLPDLPEAPDIPEAPDVPDVPETPDDTPVTETLFGSLGGDDYSVPLMEAPRVRRIQMERLLMDMANV